MKPNALRIGIDVGGTFTDAVAIDATTLALIGQSKVPTSHDHPDGVAHGIVTALHELLRTIGRSASDVVFLAHGTTQATNALLEGDVAPVGLIGIGSGPSAFFAKRLRRLGRIEIADGKRLPIEYEHVARATDERAVGAALDRFAAAGIRSVVVTEPFSVDDPIGEEHVAAIARARGFLVTATHDITSLYGLSKRTRTAVLNAVILPRMFATADLVQTSIDAAGITAPLMVMRCDGGVMSLDEMRRRPLLTVLSGPAAGVAGALMQEKLSDGIFLETGGTSTDISVIRRGKVAVQYTEFGGSSTYLSALDVRTVGVGGGSMVRIQPGGTARVTSVGPRSAHIAGLPYACFASPDDLRDARLTTIAPLDGDAADHVVLDAAGGRFAITMTCAANALGLVPETDYAHASTEVARAALAPLAAALGTDADTAARAVLDAGVAPVLEVVDRMIDDYRLPKDSVTLVGGGGGAASVTPHAGARAGSDWRIAQHSEVISPIGVALALIREQVERVIPGATDDQILAVRREAEQAVIAQGAAPSEVSVDVTVDPQSNTVRAIATGATELRTQDRTARRTDDDLRRIAATSLGVPAADLQVPRRRTHTSCSGHHHGNGSCASPSDPCGCSTATA
ncbi:hydantoinase/oxoprolinase family protein [Curtobacterium sp. MCBD17_003]|uniref:hydantoinase/oxoprolinase family protein n=1 Tax=Curtobacterium sp. MCBD17_003 TaxID=2175667 RepID=UPI001C64E497|nr:hydantoinase/oxoprolinase family protein [Curtobacterium sp. MCBD17_003]WIE55636.1 hydantoinase/oxoprolinase family protein [Curtobacterium sp. MCBD17_003]